MKLHSWIAVPAAMLVVAAHALSASAEVRLRIAGQHPIVHYGTTALNQIKADLDATDVGLKVKLLPAGQLGNGEEVFGDVAKGKRAAAIGHYRDMLRLNPNDNQGLRHVLASWLLATGDHGALEELLAAYDDDVFAEWAYAKTLLALRKGDEADARTALSAAWKRNPHVPALLTGAMPIPEHRDDHYTLGSPDEAVIYVSQNRENWTATRGALQWLAETVQTLPPPDEKRP